MEKPYDIQERAFLYACEIVDFCRPLVTGHPLVRELGRQLLRAGTSVGETTVGGSHSVANNDRGSNLKKRCALRASSGWGLTA